MLLHNMLEYNYYLTLGSLNNYYSDDMNNDANQNNADNYRICKNKAVTTRFLANKSTIIAKTPINNNILNRKVVVPLKYLEFLEVC